MNDDLLAPLVSESFTNVAALAEARFTDTGTTGTVSSTTASIYYDTSARSYTLTTPTGSITFGPGDIDNSQSSADAIVYMKSSGSTINSLTMTRPGTSGSFTYKYVGGAFWQQTVQTSPTRVDASFDTIVYGVETLQSNRQVSGAANYQFDLLGAMSSPGGVTAMTGSGTATVDFATGNIIFIGDMLVSSGLPFYGRASISSSSPEFSGTLAFYDTEYFEAILQGGFFGPNSAEIGATFRSARDDGRVAVGALLGRKGPADTGNAKFTGEAINNQLLSSQTFNALEASLEYRTAKPDGQFSNVSAAINPVSIRYDAATGSYLVISDGRLFNIVGIGGVNGLEDKESGSWGTRYASTANYVRVAQFTLQSSDAFGDDRRDAFQIYGMPTADGAIPRTGTGGYGVRVDARIVDNAYDSPIRIDGYGDFFVNFATGRISAYVPVDYHLLDNSNATLNQGDWTFDGTLSASTNGFTGNVAFGGIGNYSGTGQGKFYGPSNQEVGGLFSAIGPGGAKAVGAFWGGLDPSAGDPTIIMPGLTELDADAELYIQDNYLGTQGFTDLRGISYDAASGNYVVNLQAADFPLDSTSFNAAKSNSDVSVYQAEYYAAGQDLIVTAPNLTSGTSDVALTYTMILSFEYLGNNPAYPGVNKYAMTAAGIKADRIPLSGTATYDGVTRGFARVVTNGASGNEEVFSLAGTVSVDVDFTNDVLTGNFSDLAGDRIYAFDPVSQPATSRVFSGFTLNGNFLTTYPEDFFGSANKDGWSRRFTGAFFGSNAAEIGGEFTADFGNGSSPEQVKIIGAFIGAKN